MVWYKINFIEKKGDSKLIDEIVYPKMWVEKCDKSCPFHYIYKSKTI